MPHTTMLFKKPLKPTDITKRLAIRSKSLKFFPHFNGSHAIKLNIGYEGKVWPISCSTRKQGYKKPVFSKGWMPFVRENHLNVGDVVTLYREDDEAGSWCRIEVERSAGVPPLDGKLGVAARYMAKQEAEIKQVGEPFKNSKKMKLGLVNNSEKIVLNLDLTLAPPGEL